jgi:hypothetical protein
MRAPVLTNPFKPAKPESNVHAYKDALGLEEGIRHLDSPREVESNICLPTFKVVLSAPALNA